MLWRGILWGMPLFSVVGRVVHSKPNWNKGVSMTFSKLLMPGMLCFPTQLPTKFLLHFSYLLTVYRLAIPQHMLSGIAQAGWAVFIRMYPWALNTSASLSP